MNIGKKIAQRRKEIRMTQEMLAEKLGLSAQAVSRWENGWNLPDIENIGLIAEALKMSSSASPHRSCLFPIRSGRRWSF